MFDEKWEMERQEEIRNRLESLPRVIPQIGEMYVGIVPRGEYGWVHGRRGIYLGENRLRCPETGKEFPVLWVTRMVRKTGKRLEG